MATRETGSVKWFNDAKGMASSSARTAWMCSCITARSVAKATVR